MMSGLSGLGLIPSLSTACPRKLTDLAANCHFFPESLNLRLYDPAVYYTNDEYFSKYNKMIDVQTAVESPAIYIIARCCGSDRKQLAYVDTRLECLYELNINAKFADGHEIRDKMRFFHVDGPAIQQKCILLPLVCCQC